MRRTLHRLVHVASCLIVAGSASGQDVLHYKFESGGGDKVINFASGDPTAPREARIDTLGSIGTAWTTGRFGTALNAGVGTASRGYAVDTGWRYRLPGDFTLAFFFRTGFRAFPLNDVRLLGAGGRDAFLLRLLGRTGVRGFLELAWGPTATTARLARDVLTPATTGWTHVALVVRPTARAIRLYVDGKPAVSQSLPRVLPPIRGSSQLFTIADRGAAFFAWDEFRLVLRAATDAEILAWASVDPAAHAAFGRACHPHGRAVLLDAKTGGLPKLGNAKHALTVYGLPGSNVVLGLGSNNQQFLGTPLPLDLGFLRPELRGCAWRSSAELFHFGTIGPTGALAFPLPIPNLPGASGARLFSQALVDSPILRTAMLTNGFATVAGR